MRTSAVVLDSTALIWWLPASLDATDWAGQRRSDMTAREYLAESINEPGAFIAPTFAVGNGTAMPNLALTPDEVDALVDYLLSE